MLRLRPQRRLRKGRPPVYPRKPSREELMENYDKWLENNPGVEEFSEDEMLRYLKEGWDIKRIINYRLLGVYDEWISKQEEEEEVRFSEAEFDLFFDRGVSIETILSRRPRKHVPKTVKTEPVEYYYHIESPRENEDSSDFEYVGTEVYSDEIENEM